MPATTVVISFISYYTFLEPHLLLYLVCFFRTNRVELECGIFFFSSDRVTLLHIVPFLVRRVRIYIYLRPVRPAPTRPDPTRFN